MIRWMPDMGSEAPREESWGIALIPFEFVAEALFGDRMEFSNMEERCAEEGVAKADVVKMQVRFLEKRKHLFSPDTSRCACNVIFGNPVSYELAYESCMYLSFFTQSVEVGLHLLLQKYSMIPVTFKSGSRAASIYSRERHPWLTPMCRSMTMHLCRSKRCSPLNHAASCNSRAVGLKG